MGVSKIVDRGLLRKGKSNLLALVGFQSWFVGPHVRWTQGSIWGPHCGPWPLLELKAFSNSIGAGQDRGKREPLKLSSLRRGRHGLCSHTSFRYPSNSLCSESLVSDNIQDSITCQSLHAGARTHRGIYIQICLACTLCHTLRFRKIFEASD